MDRFGERRTLRGVHFIKLKGTVKERARAHARLLKDEILRGPIPALAHKNEGMIRKSPGITKLAPVQASMIWFYRNMLLPHMDRRNLPEVRDLMHELSDETGIPYREYLQALFQADALMLLCRLSMMKYTLGDLPSGGIPGCTSAVTLKEWNKDGRLLVCRNQDYPMVGPWEENTTVMFQEPSEPGMIPHVSVTSAGVHTAGLTSMNREGLTLATHAHFGRHFTLKGTPVIDIGNDIIRRAKSIGEAVDIARKYRPYANWAFVVSSAKENDAVVLEMTPKEMRVRHAEDGFLAHSNYFHSRELQNQEALLSGACVEDLQSRICRIRQVLEPARGKLEPRHMTAALGDHIDYLTGEERVMGNTVSVVTTIKSVVFDPLAQKLWVSSRKESPQGLGEFLEVNVDQFWNDAHRVGEAEWPSLPGYVPRNPALVEGMQHYREAYRAHHMESDHPDSAARTLAGLRKAARAFPSDGNLWVQLGIVAFNAHEFKEARDCFERTHNLKLSSHVGAVRDLFLARCLDVAGEREAGLLLYRTGANTNDPNLRRAMLKGLKRPYKASDTASMMIDLQFPDTFHY